MDGRTPVEILKDSDNLNRRLLQEAREEIREIDDDDPDRVHKIHRAKLRVLAQARYNHDLLKGYTGKEARTRKNDRMRMEIKKAINLGAIPPMTEDGRRPSTKNPESANTRKEKSEVRNRNAQ
eukprot:4759253-Karenia_brevis.AAC.1